MGHTLFLPVLLLLLAAGGCKPRAFNESNVKGAIEHVSRHYSQKYWRHDYDLAKNGYFHTYDELALPGGGKPRKVHVYLPFEYERDASRRFPVMYMNDGQNVFFQGEFGSWALTQILDEFIVANPNYKPFIIVAIHPLDGRFPEYSHTIDPPAITEANCCKLSQYADYVANKLKPFIDSEYRTLPEAASTAMVGSSLGGLAAFYTAAKYRNKFGLVVAMSPSFLLGAKDLGVAKGKDSIIQHVGHSLSAKGPRPRIWIDHGTNEENQLKRPIEETVDILRRHYGYDSQTLEYFIDEGGMHREASWGRRMRLVFEKYYK